MGFGTRSKGIFGERFYYEGFFVSGMKMTML